MNTKILIVGLVSSLIILQSSLGQGLLTPPGAPAPTMKTLDQIEPGMPISSLPFVITNSGSYYLVTNLTLVSTNFQDGISIQANNVAIDLKGFTLSGQGITGSGIALPNTQTNIAVHDGTLRSWGYRGIDVESGVNCQLLRLLASDNTDSGIVAGLASTVVQCTGVSNGYAGILAAEGCVVQACAAMFNGNVGISANAGSTISDCTSLYNIGGFSIGTGGTIRGCSARGNQEDGISGFQATILDCTVQANQMRGIVASSGSTVSRCTARINSQHGIQVGSSCTVSDNTCELNGNTDVGAGIRVTGSQNRIDGNHLVSNDYGIQVIATNNLIIRNSAASNGTNYLFTGAQIFGPTNNLVGAGGVITNQNPWANFTF